MSALYRCRARVGYKPYKTDNIILFDEKQIQELYVKLKWEPNLGLSNQENITRGAGTSNLLHKSKCGVTISDPLLSGLAWPALYDAASLYSASTVAAANGLLLPPCGEGEDPIEDKCFKFVDIEPDGGINPEGLDFALLYISLWYNVAGTSFGTDYYFRVNGFSISHGSGYPTALVRGEDARSVVFNQSLINMSLEEGMEIEEALKQVVEKTNFTASFCANTNENPEKKRVLPRALRFKGVTADEAIAKLLNSVNGNALHLPTKSFANKISMCTRGEVNQGCSVFYLGRGLYEGYELTGSPDLTLIERNREAGLGLNNKSPYTSETFESAVYSIESVVPNLRREAMKDVKKVPFPKQFEPLSAHLRGGPKGRGFAWKDPKPASTSGREGVTVTQERLKDTNFYGIRPNGNTAISFLSGTIAEVDGDNGRVVINTDFGLYICKPDDDKKCFARMVKQESTGLQSVSARPQQRVRTGLEIGTSTEEKPEFTRFFINGHGGEEVTLNPQIVWDWAVPQGEIKKFIDSAASATAPVSTENDTAESATPTRTSSQPICFKMGSSGRSTGPHLHAEWRPDQRLITAEQVRKYVDVAGTVTSGYRPPDRRHHVGVDIANSIGTPICLREGVSVKSVIETKCPTTGSRNDTCGGAGFGSYGNSVIISTPEGDMLLAHLAQDGIPPNITGVTFGSGGGKSSTNLQANPATQGLVIETSFKGVPRALRITPGRTILSFITDYDAWLDSGKAADVDPGVWIPKRFSNWFVKDCELKWRDGDLRVNIEAVSQWGVQRTSVPTFTEYLASMKKAGEIKQTKDYYGYIRSLGDLQWLVETEDGEVKDSTEIGCPEAQAWVQPISTGPDSTQPINVQNAFPAANCRTGDPIKDQVINALYSVGINTPNAFAGVLGNFQVESGIQANRHNLANPGSGCSSTRSGPLGPVGYGIAQWCGSRQTNIFNKCGRVSTLSCELSFMVEEIRKNQDISPKCQRDFKGIMNSSRSPQQSADNWNECFERGPGGIQKRRDAAAQILPQIKCDRPTQ